MADKHTHHADRANGHKAAGGHGHFRHVIDKPAAFADVLSLGGLTQKTFEKLRTEVANGSRRRLAPAK